MNTPLITVSIVTYNAEQDIRKCLESLKKQTFKDFQVVIVDNHSTDKTVEIAKKTLKSVMLIESERNLGFGAAHNLAISKSTSEWILVLNPDTILEPHALQTLYSHTDIDDVAAISGILYHDEGKTIVDSTGISLHPLFYHAKERKRIPTQNDYPWGLSGACVLLRKEALHEISYARKEREYPEYFDEFFFLYKEDVDLAARLQEHEWRSYFVAQEIGIHARTASVETQRKDKPIYIKKNSYKHHFFFLIKHARLYAFPFIIVYELAKFCYLLINERSVLSVLPEVWKMTPKLLKRRYV